MVVATLALHRLDEDRGDLVAVALEGRLDLGDGLRLGCLDVVGDVAFEIELDGRVEDPGPVELGEQADLVGQRVGEAEGVAAATVERLTEVQDHQVVDGLVERRAAELAGLPVEGRLQGVLHGERPAGDPEVVGEPRRGHA